MFNKIHSLVYILIIVLSMHVYIESESHSKQILYLLGWRYLSIVGVYAVNVNKIIRKYMCSSDYMPNQIHYKIIVCEVE